MLPKISIRFERWKWNSEHEVWVSTEGRMKDHYKRDLEYMLRKGYPHFFSETHQSYQSVHRVVLKTFRPREDMDQLTVEHIDQNPRNPALRNLMWLTQQENTERGQRHQLKEPKSAQRVCANGVNMTVEDAVNFLWEMPGVATGFSKTDMRNKIIQTINSTKEVKKVFGITFTEVKK